MAFKFKVKKRPNLGQAVASSFAAGAVQGGQMALQKMLQEREENKKNSSQNLNTFNSLISGLPQTPENRSSILNARLSVLQGGDPVLAVKAISDGGLDYETPAETKKREENELKNLEATEESLRRKIGMVGSQPTPEEIAARKAENKNSDADLLKEAEILEEQVKRDIGMVGNVPTKEEVAARKKKPSTPKNTMEQNQIKMLEKQILEAATATGLTFDEFVSANPTNTNIILYQRMTNQPIVSQSTTQDSLGKTRFDTNLRLGSPTVGSAFDEMEDSPSDVQRALGAVDNTPKIAINPATGQRIIYNEELNKWQPVE
tara:strand:+ start:498 stop:1448 length:951 start_codon:yes stop_codon:yes gene_type:complete